MILFVSDNSEFIANYTLIHHPESQLLTEQTLYLLDDVSHSVFHTSLADLSWDHLLDACLKATNIIYRPPVEWESDLLKVNTEFFLTNLIINHSKEVNGFIVPSDKYKILGLKNKRNTTDAQLWIVGCSYAAGRGLLSTQDRYGVILSKKLQMPYCDLSDLGTSICWSADQLLRSDLQPGDIVIWGITGVNRQAYYTNNQQWFASAQSIDELDSANKIFFRRLLLDNNILFEAIKSIKQVVNVCSKLNCKLVIFLHGNLSIKEHTQILKEYLAMEPCYLNISNIQDSAPLSDKHPGLETNKKWAQEIFDFITNQSCTN
jgi:hypothetical protein